ncbi:hypothetical protein GCM10009745_51790 [Kribbella yunnanensis]|uniref:Uncharacterized protein n=1 Tax=Kribbella yunnanensis TaxID=190194 RepID=A0ABP4U4A4_9ACTN
MNTSKAAPASQNRAAKRLWIQAGASRDLAGGPVFSEKDGIVGAVMVRVTVGAGFGDKVLSLTGRTEPPAEASTTNPAPAIPRISTTTSAKLPRRCVNMLGRLADEKRLPSPISPLCQNSAQGMPPECAQNAESTARRPPSCPKVGRLLFVHEIQLCAPTNHFRGLEVVGGFPKMSGVHKEQRAHLWGVGARGEGGGGGG